MHKIINFRNQNKKEMEHQDIVESILKTVKSEVSVFVGEESSIQCPIEYESRVIEIARKFSQGLILGTQGKLPKSRNAKKKF